MCVKAVKANYNELVLTFSNNYQNFDEPEALGLNKILSQFLFKKAEDDIAKQLKELVTNEMLITMFPNLSKIASICLTIPVLTASGERSFSEMKFIKTNYIDNCCSCVTVLLMYGYLC